MKLQQSKQFKIEQELRHNRLHNLECKQTKTGEHSIQIEVPPFSSRYDQDSSEGIDYQREYECLRDSLTKIKLSNELKLLESKSGTKRQDDSLICLGFFFFFFVIFLCRSAKT